MWSTLLIGSHLGKLGLHGDKWAVSSSGSTVQVVGAAEPSLIWAASSWARCLMWSTLLVGSHLGKLGLYGDKWAVSSSGSTVQVVRATEPSLIWAASSRARCLMWSTLLVGSHLSKLGLHGDKWAVSSSGSTVQVVGAAEPSLIWAASSWARCLMWSTLLVGSHLGKLGLHGDKWAVSSSD